MGTLNLGHTCLNMLLKACPLVLASISAFPADFDWETWKLEHNKHYSTADLETEKYEIFNNNRNFINNHNNLFSEGHESYSVKINKFADLTNEEFAEKYLTATNSDSLQAPDWEREEDNYECPTEFVFTKQPDGSYPPALTYAGYMYNQFEGELRVTPVKDQGSNCGSGSWAFAASGAIEAAMCMNGIANCTAELWQGVSSQQQLDCCSNSDQCDGGYPTNGIECIIRNDGGIENSSDYPFTGTPSTCAYQSNSAITPGVTSCGKMMPGNENQMHQLLYQEGPAAVRIDGSGIGFQFYYGGVYVSNICSATKLNHAMVATGYGTSADQYGKEFWECKNSWGTGWGYNGYVFMKRNHGSHGGNMCGIATDVTYAIME